MLGNKIKKLRTEKGWSRKTLSELLNVHGIGQAKAEQFGRRILKIVRND